MLDCSNRPSYQRMSSTQQIRKQFLAPKRQPVLDEFKCWISSSTLIQGHLYCMETHLSFYAGDGDSPIRIVTPFDSIIDIIKNKASGFEKNGIRINCKNGRSHLFIGFAERSETVKRLNSIFQSYKKTELNNQLVQHMQSNSRNEIHSKMQAKGLDMKFCLQQNILHDVSNHKYQKIRYLSSLKSTNSIETIEVVFSISVKSAFDVLFGDNAVYSLMDHLSKIGSYDIKIERWQSFNQDKKGTRKSSFIKPTNPWDTVEIKGRVQAEDYYEDKGDTILFERKAKLLDYPLSERFYVEERLNIVSVADSPNKCLLRGYVSTVFENPCIYERIIREKICAEVKNEHKSWIQYITEHNILENVEKLVGSFVEVQPKWSIKEACHEVADIKSTECIQDEDDQFEHESTKEALTSQTNQTPYGSQNDFEAQTLSEKADSIEEMEDRVMTDTTVKSNECENINERHIAIESIPQEEVTSLDAIENIEQNMRSKSLSSQDEQRSQNTYPAEEEQKDQVPNNLKEESVISKQEESKDLEILKTPKAEHKIKKLIKKGLKVIRKGDDGDFYKWIGLLRKSTNILSEEEDTITNATQSKLSFDSEGKDISQIFDSPLFSSSSRVKNFCKRIFDASISKITVRKLKHDLDQVEYSSHISDGTEMLSERLQCMKEEEEKVQKLEHKLERMNQNMRIVITILIILLGIFIGTSLYLIRQIPNFQDQVSGSRC